MSLYRRKHDTETPKNRSALYSEQRELVVRILVTRGKNPKMSFEVWVCRTYSIFSFVCKLILFHVITSGVLWNIFFRWQKFDFRQCHPNWAFVTSLRPAPAVCCRSGAECPRPTQCRRRRRCSRSHLPGHLPNGCYCGDLLTARWSPGGVAVKWGAPGLFVSAAIDLKKQMFKRRFSRHN